MKGYPNLNRAARWRQVFAGWQLGSRSIEDPECQAVRDHREATIILRIELTALAGLLIEKGLLTHDEIVDRIEHEAAEFDAMMEKRFPGMKATDDGIEYDVPVAVETMKGWRP